jgi:hypothetical protein
MFNLKDIMIMNILTNTTGTFESCMWDELIQLVNPEINVDV